MKNLLKLPQSDGYLLVEVEKIIRIETERFRVRRGQSLAPATSGDGNLTHVYLIDGRHILMCRRIGIWEKLLKAYKEQFPEGDFLRVHQSHVVNLNHVDKIRTKEGMELIMNGGKENVPVARDKVKYLMDRLNSRII